MKIAKLEEMKKKLDSVLIGTSKCKSAKELKSLIIKTFNSYIEESLDSDKIKKLLENSQSTIVNNLSSNIDNTVTEVLTTGIQIQPFFMPEDKKIWSINSRTLLSILSEKCGNMKIENLIKNAVFTIENSFTKIKKARKVQIVLNQNGNAVNNTNINTWEIYDLARLNQFKFADDLVKKNKDSDELKTDSLTLKIESV